MADGSAGVLRAMAVAAESSKMKDGVADDALESTMDKLVVPEEQTVLPKASKGMVRHAVQPPSPLVVPPAVEEDEVEEIECEES